MSDLSFRVVGARAEPYAAVPTLMLRLAVADAGGEAIQAVSLRAQVQIEPRRRHYTGVEEERLVELFGEPHRWGDTLQTQLWTIVTINVPSFRGQTEVDLPITCTYDFEVASAKYFQSLDDGEIPLLLLFSGTVFARGTEGQIRVDQVPWHQEASFRLPVRVWRDVMDVYFPDSTWFRVRRETFDAVHRFRGRHGFTGWDETLDELLRRAGERVLS